MVLRARTSPFTNTQSLSSTSIIYGSNPLFQIFYNIIVFFFFFFLLPPLVNRVFTFICFFIILSLSNRFSIQIEFIGLFYTLARTQNRTTCFAAHRKIYVDTGYTSILFFPFIQLICNSVMD